MKNTIIRSRKTIDRLDILSGILLTFLYVIDFGLIAAGIGTLIYFDYTYIGIGLIIAGVVGSIVTSIRDALLSGYSMMLENLVEINIGINRLRK